MYLPHNMLTHNITVSWASPSQLTDVFNMCCCVDPLQLDRWCMSDDMDGWCWFLGIWFVLSSLAGTQHCSVSGVSAAESSESTGLVSETDLWGYTIRTLDCIFSLQRSHRSTSDRRLLTVIGRYLGGCQLNRQLSTFYASSVCLECQRSGALNVWSLLTGHWEFMVIWE